MDTKDSYKTNLNTVREMILDEEKLITFISISKDLCIHVNCSKQLLCRAIKTIREEHPNMQLNISYIISGLSGSNTGITTICPETDLDKLIKSMSVVFYYHVYSICRGSPGVDNADFVLLNKYEDYSLCPGLIRSKECVKWTSDEIGNLKTHSQEIVDLVSKPLLISNKKFKHDQENVSAPSLKNQVEDIESDKQTETKIKVEITIPEKGSDCKHKVQKSNGLKAQKGISSFFNKSNGSQPKKVTNSSHCKKMSNDRETKTISGCVDSIVKDEKMHIENSEIGTKMEKERSDKKLKKELKSIEKKLATHNPIPDEKTKALNKIIKSSKIDKKRKRVLLVSDSEDDEDNKPFVDSQETNNESDDEIPPTPLANSIKITCGIVNPKKRRKIVDKTYTDDDGYILTKKEEVYESCSEYEDEEKVGKNIISEKEVKKGEGEVSPKKYMKSPKKPKKKISPPQKGKQPTLNSFFNRK